MFVDEAGLNLSMSRLFARAQAGERAIGSIPENKGGNVTLLGALNLDGLIASIDLLHEWERGVPVNTSRLRIKQY